MLLREETSLMFDSEEKVKRILITGKNSYIGDSIKSYLLEFPDYYVDVLDVQSKDWVDIDFSLYEIVIDVAGIAHVKETPENKNLYYTVNRDLAFEIAKKAKASCVKKFIYFSSMSVYGQNSGTITLNTVPNPVNHYGKSKLEAEHLLSKLSTENFKVLLLRPPMVYGKGCRGNFQSIKRIIELSPIFPKVKNQRSMLYIGNLCEFVRQCIEMGDTGLYYPQNDEYMNTSILADTIATGLGKRIILSRLLGLLVKLFIPYSKLLEKAFGSLIYDIPKGSINKYNIKTVKESIINSV